MKQFRPEKRDANDARFCVEPIYREPTCGKSDTSKDRILGNFSLFNISITVYNPELGSLVVLPFIAAMFI